MPDEDAVPINAGGTIHRLTPNTAILLAENLRTRATVGQDEADQQASRSAADKLEAYLVGATDIPVAFTHDERIPVFETIDAMCASETLNTPDMRALFWALRGLP